MLRQVLAILLALLIPVQSVLAIGDLHLHEPDSDHLATHVEHVPSPLAETDEGRDSTSSSSPSQIDYQNCCHCHGVVQPCLAVNLDGIKLSVTALQLAIGTFNRYGSIHLSPDLRPPIT